MQQSCRCKRIRINQRDILDFMISNQNLEHISGFSVKSIILPNDYQVINVYYAPEYRSFFFIIESEEFEEIYDGDEIPILDYKCYACTLDLIK